MWKTPCVDARNGFACCCTGDSRPRTHAWYRRHKEIRHQRTAGGRRRSSVVLKRRNATGEPCAFSAPPIPRIAGPQNSLVESPRPQPLAPGCAAAGLGRSSSGNCSRRRGPPKAPAPCPIHDIEHNSHLLMLEAGPTTPTYGLRHAGDVRLKLLARHGVCCGHELRSQLPLAPFRIRYTQVFERCPLVLGVDPMWC